ncbi:hypothetical protein ACFWIA_19265 [Streptomyces sp. NPDC127068]|uniref:hypothetical protein n=1 Tax=Streptomyces sp. NPDC127068 TaxID=3347127 RepID=UPI00365F1233
MSRRVSLPGADELFRTTGGTALQASSPRRPTSGEPRVPPPAAAGDEAAVEETAPARRSATQVPGRREAPAPAEGDDEHTVAEADAADSRARTSERGTERSSDAVDQPLVRPAGRRTAPEGTAGTPGGSTGSPRGAQPGAAAGTSRRRGRSATRRPSGRERHDEKITVYVSAEELMDLEHARLVLRGEHGLAVDRGRIVREAVAVVLADLESRGDASILVRRLRGR